MLNANGQADITWGHAGLELFFRGKLRMRRRCRVYRQRARFANIGNVIKHLQLVDEFSAGIAAASITNWTFSSTGPSGEGGKAD